jgi:hypothetical protein
MPRSSTRLAKQAVPPPINEDQEDPQPHGNRSKKGPVKCSAKATTKCSNAKPATKAKPTAKKSATAAKATKGKKVKPPTQRIHLYFKFLKGKMELYIS